VSDMTKHQELSQTVGDSPVKDLSRESAQRPVPLAVRRRGGWIIAQEAGRYTLARHWPAQFDLSVSTHLPIGLRPGRLARQIRQDLWRELRNLRGFSPVVEIVTNADGMLVRAGGRLLAGPGPVGTRERLEALISEPARRERWCHWARAGGQVK